jgi:hypothetical protein
MYRWPDVRLPKGELMLSIDHDERNVIGVAYGFSKTRAGVQCQIKLGQHGEELFRRGFVGISAEVNENTGEIFGASMCVTAVPGFASARILDPPMQVEPVMGFSDPLRKPVAVQVPGGPITVVGPLPLLAPPSPSRPAADLTDHNGQLAAMSMSAVHAEVASRRKRFDRWQEELKQEELLEEEARLMAGGVPTLFWPVHLPGRQRWDVYQAQVEAAERQEYETRRIVQLLEYELAAAASVPPPTRPWWRRIGRRRR